MGIHYTVVLIDEMAWGYAHGTPTEHVASTLQAMKRVIGTDRDLEHTLHDNILIVETGKGWPGEYFWQQPGVVCDAMYTMQDREAFLKPVTESFP